MKLQDELSPLEERKLYLYKLVKAEAEDKCIREGNFKNFFQYQVEIANELTVTGDVAAPSEAASMD